MLSLVPNVNNMELDRSGLDCEEVLASAKVAALATLSLRPSFFL